MSQRQFESGVDVGRPTDLTMNNSLIKQVMLENTISQNQASTRAKGLAPVPNLFGAGVQEATAHTLFNYQQYAAEARAGAGMLLGIGGTPRRAAYGQPDGTTRSIMTDLWSKSQLSATRGDSVRKSTTVENDNSFKSKANKQISEKRSLSGLAAENTVVMPACAGDFAFGTKVSPKKWDSRAGRHISAEALELAASLQITGQTHQLTADMSEALNRYEAKLNACSSENGEIDTPLQSNQQREKQGTKLEAQSRTDSTASTARDGDQTGEPPTVTAAIREVLTLQVVDNTAPKVTARTESVNPAPGPAAVKKTIADSAASSSRSAEPTPIKELADKGTIDEQAIISAEALPKARAMDLAFKDAHNHSQCFENQRAQRQAERDIADIETNRKRFKDSSERNAALEEARGRKTNFDAALKDNTPKYAQTLKKLSEFIRSVEEYARVEQNATTRDFMLRDAVVRLEELMMPIDNIWNGIAGKTADLPRPGVKTPGARPVWPEERLSQIHSHLEAKINTVDGAQAQRVNIVRDNATFREIFRLFDEEKLPREGSLVFFTREGTLLYQSELKVSPKAYQSRAKDAASAERHANNTPAFIDVSRLQRGNGPEGAGLWRFIGQESRIIGAAVLHPVMRDGKPVELPGARNKHGEPMVKKEVVMIINEVPEGIAENMAYGHMLNTMRAKKLAHDRNSAESSGNGSRQTQQRFSPESRSAQSQSKGTSDSSVDSASSTNRMIGSEV